MDGEGLKAAASRQFRSRRNPGGTRLPMRPRSGVRRATPSGLLNENASLSPETAFRIEKAFGVSKDTLLRMGRGSCHAAARRQHRRQALRTRSARLRRGQRSQGRKKPKDVATVRGDFRRAARGIFFG